MYIGPVSCLGRSTKTKIQFWVLLAYIALVFGNVVNVLLLSAFANFNVWTCFRLSHNGLGGTHRLRGQELHIKLYVKFTSVRALFWLANEEARERIGVDAVRGVGPLRMIRREVNCTAVASGLRGG